MFRIDTSGQFKWPVQFHYPTHEGKRETATYTGIFKRLPESEVAAALTDKTRTVEQVVQDVFLGFEDVQNEDGTPMQSTAENIAKLLTMAGMSTAIFTAFFDAISQAKEKN